jgi:hypothetical protein
MEPLLDAADVEFFRGAADRATQKMRRTRADDCPTCAGPDSARFRECRSAGDGSLFDGAPMCRYASAAALAAHDAEVRSERVQRLTGAGVSDPDILRIVPGAVAEPPQPPAGAFASPADRDLHELARLAVDDFGRGRADETILVLAGDPGAGKSLLAAWVVATLRGSRKWLSPATFGSPDAWDAARADAFGAYLVVMDDAGRERDGETKWASSTLAELLCARADAGRRTVITTNIGKPEFAARYGARLVSRMAQRGRWLDCGKTDLRIASRRALRVVGATP